MQPGTGEVDKMAEYIKREDALKALKIARGYCPCAYDEIVKLPAIDPIHAAGGCYCRECVNYYEYDDWDRCHQETYTAHECGIFNRDLGPDGFCSRGEPKKEAEE